MYSYQNQEIPEYNVDFFYFKCTRYQLFANGLNIDLQIMTIIWSTLSPWKLLAYSPGENNKF